MLRRAKAQPRRKNIALALLVAVSAFALLYAPVRGALTSMAYNTAPGIWRFGENIHDAWTAVSVNFHIKRSLLHENEVLHEDVARMQTQVLDRNLLEERVTKLEEALGRAGSDSRVVADVLVSPSQTPYDTLVIDAGTEHGIAVGDRVVYAGAGVVGEVTEAYESSAKVKLYSFPGEEQSVSIGSHAVPGVVRGRGMGNFEVKVSQGSLVAQGDEVRTSGGNLILGTVGSVEEKPAEPSARVLFRTLFNIAEIRSVEVLVKK